MDGEGCSLSSPSLLVSSVKWTRLPPSALRFSGMARSGSEDVLVRRQGFVGVGVDLDEGILGTYVWFSPFGARNHAAPQKMTVTMRPIMGAQLHTLAGCMLQSFFARD
jgi:hypothetical protein